MMRPAHRDPEASESYLESLSDLLVGMLFIFIIILMVYALNYREAQQQTRQVTERLANAAQLRSDLLSDLRLQLKRQGIPVAVDPTNGVMHLPESLLFDSGSAEFKPSGHRALAVLSRELEHDLPCYTFGHIPSYCPRGARPIIDALFIEGHTDNVPIQNAGFYDNWDLSAARSKSTFQNLVKSSAMLARITNERRQPLLSISAYGDTRPVASNVSDEGRRRNRRIDLRFIISSPRIIDNSPSSGLIIRD
jgi:chemotaxis protein MotB